MNNILKSLLIGFGSALLVVTLLFIVLVLIPLLADVFKWNIELTIILYGIWILGCVFTFVSYCDLNNKNKKQ